MKRFKVVGWYVRDAHNEHMVPFARIVIVKAWASEAARAKGAAELDKLYVKANVSCDLLGQFCEEVKR